MADENPHTTITAVADINASPTDPKKAKLYHVETEPQSLDQPSHELEGGTSSSSNGNSNKEERDKGLETPVSVAVPLPVEELEEEEEWWDLKMSWSGKIFDMKVASNDM